MSDQISHTDLETEFQSDAQSDAMNDQLRSDVASWKASRSEETARRADISVPVSKPVTSRPTRPRATKAVTVTPLATDGKKKPFGMSYDGMSQADYITYMISRGAR
jgi:hypothetical protein